MSRLSSFLYILYVLLSVLYVNSEPSSDLPESQTSNSTSVTTSKSTNDVELRCFTPVAGRLPLNSTDCTAAFMKLVFSRGFNIVYRFSKNIRRLDVIRLPEGWSQGDCVIMLSCANDQDTAAFRLSDVAHAARAIMNNCVVGRDPAYGGIVGVSDVPSFYVSVAGPATDLLEGNSTIIDGMELGGNITLLDAQLGENPTLLDTE